MTILFSFRANRRMQAVIRLVLLLRVTERQGRFKFLSSVDTEGCWDVCWVGRNPVCWGPAFHCPPVEEQYRMTCILWTCSSALELQHLLHMQNWRVHTLEVIRICIWVAGKRGKAKSHLGCLDCCCPSNPSTFAVFIQCKKNLQMNNWRENDCQTEWIRRLNY